VKRVLLLAYTNQNLGDDLFIYTICKCFPKTQFYLFSSGDYKRKNIIRNLHIYTRDKKYKEKIIKKFWSRRADAIVFVGGSLFWELPGSHTEVTMTSIHDRMLSLSKGTYNEKTPFFLLGCNFGPYITEDYRYLHEKVFEKFRDVCFRDEYSYSLFRNSANVRYAPDIVFNLYGHFHGREEKYIVVSMWGLMEPGNGDSRNKYYRNLYRKYREKLIEIVKYYCMKGKKVLLISFCGSEGDELGCKRIQSGLTEKERKQVAAFFYKGNITKAVSCLEKAEMIIATRFHAMILGWLMGKVVFPISYECKTENVIKDLGFKGKYAVLEEIESLKMEDVEYNYINHLVPDISKLAEQSKGQFSVLRSYIT